MWIINLCSCHFRLVVVLFCCEKHHVLCSIISTQNNLCVFWINRTPNCRNFSRFYRNRFAACCMPHFKYKPSNLFARPPLGKTARLRWTLEHNERQRRKDENTFSTADPLSVHAPLEYSSPSTKIKSFHKQCSGCWIRPTIVVCVTRFSFKIFHFSNQSNKYYCIFHAAPWKCRHFSYICICETRTLCVLFAWMTFRVSFDAYLLFDRNSRQPSSVLNSQKIYDELLTNNHLLDKIGCESRSAQWACISWITHERNWKF